MREKIAIIGLGKIGSALTENFSVKTKYMDLIKKENCLIHTLEISENQ